MALPESDDIDVAALDLKNSRLPKWVNLPKKPRRPDWYKFKKDPIASIPRTPPKPKPKGPFAHIEPITPRKPAPKKPSALDRYLAGDSTYQQTLRRNKSTLADFLSELGRRKGEAGTQYKQTKSSMNRDSADQLSDLREEFASRGLIQSGLYGKEQGDFRKKFAEQIATLNQQQTGLLADLMSQEKNFRRENSLSNEAARQEALLRRAQRYRIGGK